MRNFLITEKQLELIVSEQGVKALEKGLERLGIGVEKNMSRGEKLLQRLEKGLGTQSNKSISQKLQTEMIPVSSLKRPNGQIGTQGFTSENMINLIKYISTKKGFEIPTYKTLKELIENMKKDGDIVKSITNYVESDPITAIKLPDGTINIKDGNHRANLLNLLGVENIPVVFK